MDCSLLFRTTYPFYLLKWYYKATLLIHVSKWLIRSHLPYKTLLKNRQTFWVDRKFRMPTLLSAIVALEFCRLKKHKWAGFWGLKRKPEYVRRAQSCAKIEFFFQKIFVEYLQKKNRIHGNFSLLSWFANIHYFQRRSMKWVF